MWERNNEKNDSMLHGEDLENLAQPGRPTHSQTEIEDTLPGLPGPRRQEPKNNHPMGAYGVRPGALKISPCVSPWSPWGVPWNSEDSLLDPWDAPQNSPWAPRRFDQVGSFDLTKDCFFRKVVCLTIIGVGSISCSRWPQQLGPWV